MAYKVYFVDGSVYENTNFIENLDWRLVANKRIARIEYLLPNEKIVLKDLDEYIIVTEYVTDIYGNFKIASRINNIFVVGCKMETVTGYKIDIKVSQGKYEYGNVKKYVCPRGEEFYGRPIINGWKGGE